MSNAPKNILTIAVPLRWRAPFRQAFRAEPFDPGILLPLSDWLAEHDKPTDALCCRAAYARGWLPTEMPSSRGWPCSWDWRKLKGVRRSSHFADWPGCLPEQAQGRLRLKELTRRTCCDPSVLPRSIFDTLLRGVQQEGFDVFFMEFKSPSDAMASLLCALRPVPARQLAEWCRAGGMQQ